MSRIRHAVLWFAAAVAVAAPVCHAGQADQTPTKELIQYVSDARRLKLSDTQIKQNAMKVGWSAAAIDQVLAAPRQGDSGAHTPSAKEQTQTPPKEPPPLLKERVPAKEQTPPARERSLQAKPQTPPAKELVQYVSDARQLNLSDTQIKQNAVNVGWPAAAIDRALAAPRRADSEGPAATAKATAPEAAAPANLPSIERPAIGPAPPAAPALDTSSAEPRRDRGVPDDYRIGAGDIVQISVWKEPDASVGSVVVRPDGRIAMPLVKELEVLGLTPREAEKVITDRLSKFLTAPDVTVVVTAINSKKIYLVGAVKKEGPIPYTYRMSVMQAISEAGGLTDYAKRKRIYVIRTENGKEYRLPFNYDQVLKGERMEQNIQLLANDTVVVPH